MTDSASREVRVRVTAGAKRDAVEKTARGVIVIHTKAKAERNEANHRISELLAMHLHIPTERVRLIAGHRAKTKRFRILSI